MRPEEMGVRTGLGWPRTLSSVYRAWERPVENTSRESLANLVSHSLLKLFRAAFSLSSWSTWRVQRTPFQMLMLFSSVLMHIE